MTDANTMTAEPATAARPSLSAALRARTAELHTQAERSGIVNDILRRKATRRGYVLLLRNLVPAYEAMEQGFEAHRATPGVSLFARREMYRTAALKADLTALAGPAWATELPLLGSGKAYAARVTQAAAGDGARLIAHAYARYMGDLSGGQILKKLLTGALQLSDAELSFYDFPQITDHAAFKSEFRSALDRAGTEVADVEAVVEEGATAFQLNIDVSNEVLATS